jgi:hypothetical protein
VFVGRFSLPTLCLGAAAGAVVLWLVPGLSFLFGAFALIAFPVPGILLGFLAFAIGRAARPYPDRGLWWVLGSVPLLGFASLFLASDTTWRFLARASGHPGAEQSNLGPPVLVGFALSLLLVYVALVTGMLMVRIRRGLR